MAEQWARAEDVVWEEFDGEAVLVRPGESRAWQLNPAASYVWRCCDGQAPVDAIAEGLAKEAGREPLKVTAEARLFVSALVQKGLLVTPGRTDGAGGASVSSPRSVAHRFQAPYLPPKIEREETLGRKPRRPGPRSVTGIPP